MLPKKYITALKKISNKLKGKDIKWVIVGSTSLALHGVDIKPKDIDILTDGEGALAISSLLNKFEQKPISFGETELFQSYLGEFSINGVKVEVMGDLKIKNKDKWAKLSNRLKSFIIISIDGVDLPVSSLEQMLASYETLGRDKDSHRIKKIREALHLKKKN